MPVATDRIAVVDDDPDVVVVGAGATGLPAAIEAIEAGASVILIDANRDVGGHGILSGGTGSVVFPTASIGAPIGL